MQAYVEDISVNMIWLIYWLTKDRRTGSMVEATLRTMTGKYIYKYDPIYKYYRTKQFHQNVTVRGTLG